MHVKRFFLEHKEGSVHQIELEDSGVPINMTTRHDAAGYNLENSEVPRNDHLEGEKSHTVVTHTHAVDAPMIRYLATACSRLCSIASNALSGTRDLATLEGPGAIRPSPLGRPW